MSNALAEARNIAIVPRGPVNLSAVQASNDLTANYERRMAINKYLQDAIDNGDNLKIPVVDGDNVKYVDSPVDNTLVIRRALIVSMDRY